MEVTYKTAGKNPQVVLSVMMPLASLTPHLYGVGLGRFYNTLAPAILQETYTLQMADGLPMGFAVWGLFNDVAAARFRVQPAGMSAHDFRSGSQPVLVALASPMSPGLNSALKKHLQQQHPSMSITEEM